MRRLAADIGAPPLILTFSPRAGTRDKRHVICARVFELGEDGFKNAREVLIDILVVESDDLITVRAQKLRATGVVPKLFVGRMRRAVEFDDKPFVPANEISEVRPNGLLADKLEPAKAASA